MRSRHDPLGLGLRDSAAFLNSVSSTALTAFSLGLALGVALPGEASAGSNAVSPVQSFTYLLGTFNPIDFEAATQINAPDVGVYGGSSQSWTVANYGSIRGAVLGVRLASSGSTVTNWGTIAAMGPTGVGVHLPNGGAVTNRTGGSISGYLGVYVVGASGTVTNAGSIAGVGTAVFVASGSLNNQSGGTISSPGANSANTVFAVQGGSVTNAGTITGAAYNAA